MSDSSVHSDSDPNSETAEHDELRTMTFRMRENKRLLSIRIEQENRRLEAEGIEPVSSARFQEQLVTEDVPEEYPSASNVRRVPGPTDPRTVL